MDVHDIQRDAAGTLPFAPLTSRGLADAAAAGGWAAMPYLQALTDRALAAVMGGR